MSKFIQLLTLDFLLLTCLSMSLSFVTTLQLLLALALGGLLGWEREKIGKAAGLRTYALVCMGSALFTIISVAGIASASVTAMDPSRIASQIVVGIGFLGAGSIFRHEDHIEGLTTAAGLWVSAAIGMAVGVGWYTEAVIATIITLLIFVMFPLTHGKSDQYVKQ